MNAPLSTDERNLPAFRPDEYGLTKRELIAAMVMQGLYASNGLPVASANDTYHDDGPGHIARLRRVEEAVKAADALLAVLTKDAT